MAKTRKITRRNDPFEPLVETWTARLLLRDNLWRKIRMCDCTPSDSIMASTIAHSVAMDVTDLFVKNRTKSFLSDGSYASFLKFAKKVMDLDDSEIKDCLADLDGVEEWLADIDNLKEDEIPPLPKEKRKSFLTAFLNDQKDFFEGGQALLNANRRGDLGAFWVQQRGRGTPKALTEGLERAEKRFGKSAGTRVMKAFPAFLRKNFAILSDAFHLTPLMEEAILFLLLAERSDALGAVLDLNDACYKSYSVGVETIACALNVKSSEIEAILADDGPLVSSGLLRYAEESDRSTFGFIEFSEGIPWNRFLERELSEEVIFRDLVRQAPMSSLTTEDYRHLPLVQSTLLPYLRTVLDEKRQGVNILLYGPPGTGKTELSRLVAEELDARLYEIETDSDRARLECWRAASVYLRRGERTLLALDEAEDAFSERVATRKGKSNHYVSVAHGNRKGRLHHWLESCPVPTFWITNSIEEIDPATVRRFDIVLEMNGPDQEGRRRFIQDMTALRLTDEAEERLVQTPALMPGVLARVTRVVDTLGPAGGKPSDEMVLSLVSETLRAQRYGDVASGIGILPEVYDPNLITFEIHPDELVAGIQRSGSARLCLYGPPGTGKTAFALWVARELGRPLLRRTYAELASCWVGETEQNIAKAFRQAERDKAVLLIDEADSFFRSREMSVRSWETTQVNEMLARLENFNGVFFATTNLMRDFDEAAMRRFDWKVPFGFLRPEARLALAKRYVESYKLPWTESAEALLTKLDKLTPGDYSAVARQVRFRPLRDADDWVARLKAEEDAKTVNGPKNTIGFA